VVSGLWSIAGNWDTPPTTGADLTFSAGGSNRSNTNDLASGLNVGSLTIAGNGYAIAGNAVVVQGAIAATYASGTSSVALPIRVDDATAVTVDDADATLEIGGIISGAGGITKQGEGQLTLNAANTYQGPTSVAAGTLIVNGSQSGSAVTIGAGATLGGTGVVGAITSTGGTLRPGAPSTPGRLTTSGGLTLDASSTFAVSLNGTTAGQGYSQLQTAGPVSLGGATLNVSIGFTPTGTPSFTVINNTGSAAVSGTFAGLAEGATFTVSTQTLRISYAGGDGNDVVLTRLVGSDTTLQASTSSPVFGQSVTLTATVASEEAAAGEPSGTVEFFNGSTSLGTATLANGVATLATSSLPVGADSLTARYLGNASFASSTSAVVPVQVAQASTATALTVDPTSSVSGQSVTLTAAVTAVGPGSGTPTGSVEFFHGTTSLGTATLSGGVAILATTALPVGDGSITAHYLGDGNFAASNSDGTPVDVSQATTTTTVGADPNPVGLGQSVTLTATVAVVTPGSGTPTGTVEFFNGSTSLGTANLVDGVATLQTTSLPLGANAISAHYQGDEDFAASTSAAVTVNVLPATTTTLSADPTSSVFGEQVTLTATVAADDEGGTPTGTVEFFAGTTSLGTATLANGLATLNTTALPAGTNAVTAKYLGDEDFAGSTSAAATVQVAQASTTTTLAVSPGSPVFGQSVTLTATVASASPGAGTPTGTVEFFSGTTSLGTATLVNGVATLATSSLPVGTNSVTARFTGGGNFATSTSSASSVAVAQATTTTGLTASASTSVFGQSVTLTATVAAVAPGAGTPTGTVEFFAGSTSLGTATLSNGVATLTTGAVPVGTNSITARFQGGTDFASSTSTGASLSVAQASTTTTVATTPNPSAAGQSVTLTATVAVASPGAGTPTGTVEFFAGTTSLGTATLSNGVATLSTTAIPAGSNAITAQYRGDTNYKTSTSSAVTQQVNLATTTTTVSSSSLTPGAFESVTLTATVAASNSSSTTPTGTVEFFANGVSLGTATLSGGKATLELDSLPVGVDQITAKYLGDANAAASTSSPITVVVGTANEIYVNQLYLSLLGREAEPEGLQFWSNLLDEGRSRLLVVSSIARTPGAQAALVQSAYQTYLGREATDAEVTQTINAAIRSSVNVQAVVLSSREYFNTAGGGTVSGYLSALASDVFGTSFPASVEADLASRLQRGTPPLEVVKDVLTSRAGKSALIQGSFESILGRSPTATELAQYNALADQGVYLRQINNYLFATQEFYDLVTEGADSSSS
jgi:autotransporter-associated beta strand protein